MKSFKDHIKDLNQNDWDYYSEIDERKRLENPFNENHFHEKFVKKYFERSGKSKILDFIRLLPNNKLDYERTKHTNSIFFLGVLLYKKSNLNHFYLDKINTPEYRRFPFLWFLSCVFHDFGFTIENNKDAIIGISNFEDLKNNYSINNCLLQNKPRFSNPTLFNNIENYFNFRLRNDKKIDHGVFAGIYFYDRLFKIREQKILDYNETHFWGEELLEQYAQAANAIATHNIWLPKKEDEEIYRKYKLDALIDEFQPIKFNDFPLLYILGIVDTIDPIKAFKKHEFSSDYILKNIYMEFKNDTFRIKNGENSKLDFNEILKRAKNLEGWLNVEIWENENEIKLTLK